MITEFLQKPYPLYDSKERKYLTSISFGLFIFLFLFFFKPFGLKEIPFNDAPKIISIYGLITTLVLLFNYFFLPIVIPSVSKESSWTVKREILLTLWNISLIGLFNMIYTNFCFERNYTFSQFLSFQVYTFLVAIFPVTILILLKQLILTKRNLAAALAVSSQMHHKQRLQSTPNAEIEIITESKKENFKILASNILYITSADNYIEICFLENGEPKTKLIRATLKSTRENLKLYTAFYRCHRAWIINLDHVKSLTGNSQGYRILLNYTSIEIPVSRNLNEELTNRLSK